MRYMLAVVVVLLSGVAHAQSFESAVQLAGGGNSIAVGDVNGDGLPDLLTTSVANRELLVFLADGAGRFRPPTHHPFSGPLGTAEGAFAIGDVNRDGRLDVAVALTFGIVAVMRGDGNGGFAQPTFAGVASSIAISRLAIADLTFDGNPDLVARLQNGSGLTVLEGNGAGGFGFGTGVIPAIAMCGADFLVGDFTRDGIVDVLGTCGSAPPQLARGNGTNGYAVAPVDGLAGADSIAVADFDGNGVTDFVVTDRGRAFVVLRDDPAVNGGRVLPIPLPTAPNDDGVSAAAGDFNGDGHADAAFGGAGSSVYVALGDGHGGFQSPIAVPAPSGNLINVIARDLSGDGFDDLVLGSANPLDIHVLLSKPALTPGGGTTESLARIEATLGGVATSLESVASTLQTLQTSTLQHLSALDVPVSSRASQDSVTTLNLNVLAAAATFDQKLGTLTGGLAEQRSALDVPVSSRASQDSVATLNLNVLAAAATVDQKLNTLVNGMGERHAALDAPVSSRASQQSVNDLHQTLGGLDAPVSSRASALALSSLEGKLGTLMDGLAERVEGVVLRVAIEQALLKGEGLSSFYLPEIHGGVLERVQQVLEEAIDRNKAALLIPARLEERVRMLLARGIARTGEGKYRQAFDAYSQAYQALIQ